MNLSDEIIEKKTLDLRERLGISGVSAPNMYYTLEKLTAEIPRFSFEPALSSQMGSDEAVMNEETHTLTAKECVLEDAKAGRFRARFTLAHELGHYFLGHEGIRRRNGDKGVYAGPKERMEEDEANRFASYFLVPTELAMDATCAEDIAGRFQVSAEAAEIAFERVQAARRKITREKRRPPDSVIDFLQEAKRRGHPVRSDLSEFE